MLHQNTLPYLPNLPILTKTASQSTTGIASLEACFSLTLQGKKRKLHPKANDPPPHQEAFFSLEITAAESRSTHKG